MDRKFLAVLLLCMILIGCQSIDDRGQTPAKITPRLEASEPAMVIPPGAASTPQTSEVSVPVEGIDLAGSFYVPEDLPPPWPGIILLHMLGQERSSWDAFARQLTDAGYASLSVDLRGHGETGGEVDWDLAISDLQQVWSYLAGKENIDQDRTAIIGASIGANLALIAGANEASVKTVVLLSPGLDYSGVETITAVHSFGPRPILFAASQDDPYAADSAISLENDAAGETGLIIYESAGHGLNMLMNEPGLSQQIIAWLDNNLK